MSQQPTIGRIVHYRSYGTPGGEYLPEPRAAIVTAVSLSSVGDTDAHQAETPDVSLCVLNPTGMFFNENVPFSEEPKAGHWSWPPRVEAGRAGMPINIAGGQIHLNDDGTISAD